MYGIIVYLRMKRAPDASLYGRIVHLRMKRVSDAPLYGRIVHLSKNRAIIDLVQRYSDLAARLINLGGSQPRVSIALCLDARPFNGPKQA